MKPRHLLFLCISLNYLLAQARNEGITPTITSVSVEPGTVTPLHLSPGYTTSIRLPERISSVVVGDPSTFKAEHSESEPRLAFFKPLTTRPADSNALITTTSGQEINLHLISDGSTSNQNRVDFFLDYKPPQGFLISPRNTSTSLIADTQTLDASPAPEVHHKEKPDPVAELLTHQKTFSSPQWQGKQLLVAIANPRAVEDQTVLAFSVLNRSSKPIELLPPQIILSGRATGKKHPQIKAEPVPITDYRMTTRRLEPNQRADGVVVFQRPQFKESNERLQLQLASAEQVDRPVLITLPFTADLNGGEQ